MKKQLFKLAFALSVFTSLSAISQQGQTYPCYTDEATEQYFSSNPEARKNYEVIRSKWLQDVQKQQNSSAKMAANVFTVPVVFHVLHNGGSENVSDATLISALDWVNKDFAKLNSDAGTVSSLYSASYINSDIKFMLAHKDPNGNCTSGITRHVDPVKMKWSQAGAQNPAYYPYTWDPTKYLNIYIVANIVSQGTVAGGGQVIGYTYIPGTHATGDARDGIVYRGDNLTGGDTRSLSHEIGHWLSLPHIWGGTNAPGVACGDDGIGDTPMTKGALFSCPSSSVGNTCDVTGFDNVENIMNYCTCPKNFTTGQTNAMRATLASGPVGRSNLSSPANLIATDVDGTGLCAPAADFLSTNGNYTICSGTSLTFKDVSYNGPATSWAWMATGGGTINAPSSSITAIAFPNIGTSVITLTASNTLGSSVQTRTITVLNGVPVITTDYIESFESVGTPSNWLIVNPDNDQTTWAQTSFGASNGNSSFFIEGNTNPPNKIDYLQMPLIDASDPNDTIFTFKFAYAKYNAANTDKFELQASTNCGGSWQTLISLTSTQMANLSGGTDSNPFYPTPSQWYKVNVYNYPQWTIILSPIPVLVRFMFQEGNAGLGNRFYLDEINYSSTPVGVNELSKSIHFKLYPNPTSAEALIKFNLNDAANIKLNVTDVLGKEVLPLTDTNYGPGEQSISINKNNILSKGMYFVNMSFNGAKICRKLIIQ